uniref:Uncharacterized protein n=1 Tax=Cacopsylla melanoneura TaxID=428564 RepID=A0A8D9BJB7_9HEMI
MSTMELIPDCWIHLDTPAPRDRTTHSPLYYTSNQDSLSPLCYNSDQDNIARIRLEGSPIWNENPDGFNIANSKYYQSFLKQRERQRNENTMLSPRTVRDVIPQSRLARYGNYEYNEEKESKYAMDVNVPYSVESPYSEYHAAGDVEEVWMSPLVDKLMQVYLKPDGNEPFGQIPPPPSPNTEECDPINPRLYTVDNSQHFHLELKILATKDIWMRDLFTINTECYPMVLNQSYPIIKPTSGYVADNHNMPFNMRTRYHSSSQSSYYHVPESNHYNTPYSYKSNMSSCSSSSSSSTSSPFHPIYQQQSTPKFLRRQLSPPVGSPSIKDFNLETADLSKFLLFTLDLDTKGDSIQQTIDLANSWLSPVYPAKHAQKLEVEKQLLALYTLNVGKTVGPRKSLFSSPELITPVPTTPPTTGPRLRPTQVKSSPLTTAISPVAALSSSPVRTVTELVPVTRPLSLPLSFSAVTKKGTCSKSIMEQCNHKMGDKNNASTNNENALVCASSRKSRSKHRPPHPTPTRPAGMYTTLSGYKYFSPPRRQSLGGAAPAHTSPSNEDQTPTATKPIPAAAEPY